MSQGASAAAYGDTPVYIRAAQSLAAHIDNRRSVSNLDLSVRD